MSFVRNKDFKFLAIKVKTYLFNQLKFKRVLERKRYKQIYSQIIETAGPFIFCQVHFKAESKLI